MTTKGKDYSDYIQHTSNLMSTQSLLAGFTFTAITILLTELPDRSSLMSQFTLFFLAILFDLFLFLVALNNLGTITYCKHVPPRTKQIDVHNALMFAGYCLLGVSTAFMFLLWNLTYLALASGFSWALFVILIFVFIWKPFLEYRKTVYP